MGVSHNFDREKLENYHCKTIDSDAFQKWSKDYMYKTSYAHFHSRVPTISCRIRSNQGRAPSPAIRGTFPPLHQG